MTRYSWLRAPETTSVAPPDDAHSTDRGPIITRRRFVALALYTGASVILTHRLAAPVSATSPEPVVPNLPLAPPCSPTELYPAAFSSESIDVIEPDRLEELHLLHRDPESTEDPGA